MKEDRSKLKTTGGKLFAKVAKLCAQEGETGWRLARETMLSKKSRDRKLQEAIEYAMLKYQPDYFRAALLSFACRAVGGRRQATLSTGAALTLFAWAIGIHDDVIDESRTKNGRPTVMGKFGRDLALILSDVLLFKGLTLLRKTLGSETTAERLVKVLETVDRIWFEQSEGEAFEIQHRGLTDVTPEECLEKIRMRASEIEACARIGGILGGGTVRHVEKLGDYGRLVGMMGILRNEVIDMLELDVLKHRIRKESLPLPLVYALQVSSTRPQLVKLIAKGKATKADLKSISRLSDNCGGIEKTAALIDEMSKRAHEYAKSFKNKELELLAAPFNISPEEWKKPLSD